MLDVKNPQIRVEDIMQRIQEKVRTRRGTPPPPAGWPAPVGLDLEGWQPVEETLARAQDLAQVGASVPAMTRMHGIRRALAGGVARVFLRVAQLITRDQRAFNL